MALSRGRGGERGRVIEEGGREECEREREREREREESVEERVRREKKRREKKRGGRGGVCDRERGERLRERDG